MTSETIEERRPVSYEEFMGYLKNSNDLQEIGELCKGDANLQHSIVFLNHAKDTIRSLEGLVKYQENISRNIFRNMTDAFDLDKKIHTLVNYRRHDKKKIDGCIEKKRPLTSPLPIRETSPSPFLRSPEKIVVHPIPIPQSSSRQHAVMSRPITRSVYEENITEFGPDRFRPAANPNQLYVCYRCSDPSHWKKDCPLYKCTGCQRLAPGHYSGWCPLRRSDTHLRIEERPDEDDGRYEDHIDDAGISNTTGEPYGYDG
ncbi:hypothetical protein BDZ97DRAFT_1928214 [Flammula alnicola]|nr:hypothetical protein BDZ97DRAFT_1928214 [Flammula alnicola]